MGSGVSRDSLIAVDHPWHAYHDQYDEHDYEQNDEHDCVQDDEHENDQDDEHYCSRNKMAIQNKEDDEVEVVML